MNPSKPHQPSKRQWEQALIDAYYDHRWRQILEPLYDKFKRWDAGELHHDDMDQAIHETHKKTQQVYSFFRESRPMVVAMIQWDQDWFLPWLKDHEPPPGVELDPFVRRELDQQEGD
ncbi:MAG: hypothetical protein ACOC6F_02805 [bacterium]